MGQPLHLRARTSLLAAALLATLGGASACVTTPAVVASRAPAAASPGAQLAVESLEMQTLDGKPTTLGAVQAGRPVVLSLWATWCEACEAEQAPLARLHARTDKQLLIAAIAVGESADLVRRYASAHRLPYPIFLDPDFAVASRLGSQSVPTTLVLDQSGRVVYRGGLFDGAALTAVRTLLEAETP